MVDISVVLDRDRSARVNYSRPPPVTHSLVVNAFADGLAAIVSFSILDMAGVPITVPGVAAIRTPFSAVLPEGTYTLRFPDSVTIDTVVYDYDTHTVT